MAGTDEGRAKGKAAFQAYIEGLDELVENISNFGERTVENIVAAAEVGQARVINHARSIVPVKTGALQDSIGPGRIKIDNRYVEAEVVAAMPYASYVERLKPYLRPALDANEQGFIKSIQRAVETAKAA